MATLKPVILPSDIRKIGDCAIHIQITQRGESSRIKTDISVLPAKWKDGKVTEGDVNWKKKNILISEKINAYERILLDNEDKIFNLDAKGIKSFLTTGAEHTITDFFKFCAMRLAELKKNGNKGTHNPLRNTVKLVKEYHGRNSLNFSEITPRFLEGFTSYYKKRHHKVNSIAVYMRYIRSMFNDAIDEYNTSAKNPVILNYPFRKYHIETEETKHRNLQIEVIRKLRDLEGITKREQITVDVFIFQLYLDGINIIDLFSLKPAHGGRIEYKRAKTGRYHSIKIEPEAQAIIEKYKGEKYLLWFADHCKAERTEKRIPHARMIDLSWADSDSFNKMLNENLQHIQKRLKLKLQGKLTTYYARHSLASLMREIGISKDDISLCLGHKATEKNLKTTGGYISEDFKAVDVANRELIAFVNSDCKDAEAWKKQKEKAISLTPPENV